MSLSDEFDKKVADIIKDNPEDLDLIVHMSDMAKEYVEKGMPYGKDEESFHKWFFENHILD